GRDRRAPPASPATAPHTVFRSVGRVVTPGAARTGRNRAAAMPDNLDFVVAIPARYASTRLPGKPLAMIEGRPMIAHVVDRARESGAREVAVATDDVRVAEAVAPLGIKVVMTDPAHAS